MVHGGGGYDSDFSDDDVQAESSERGLKRKREEEILQKPFQKGRHSQVAHRSLHSNEVDRAKDKTDLDVLRENHRFLWRDEDEDDMTWEKELAKKYYDKLFKEYCIADLSRYKENKDIFIKEKTVFASRKEVKSQKKTKRLSEENLEPPQKKKKRKKKNRKSSSSQSKKHKQKRRRDRSSSSSSSEESQDKDSDAGAEPEGQSEADHWRGPAPAVEEKSRE
ncbi:hypothetical protein L3Q82_001016 [Scortum barcoo]|uniref:Uncharacterized protein n=1 Tax=Scortum barcoo TaxID=214431 RepID=A0ACB8WAZ5_9TELE|nr:hypothetical protein L3Q82_001016 [Scortum barcoo]